ncbi:hypothetical protein GDO81_018937 [Engystomops pustulosus]|uniref:Secreted protein n=1 Tax=Engystomops pustulosus TaxID=76066 RepID=A0AAV6YIU9_ENGPU|nr:hypothetical protein GDO81_018937 [Engystomops pustulosus]
MFLSSIIIFFSFQVLSRLLSVIRRLLSAVPRNSGPEKFSWRRRIKFLCCRYLQEQRSLLHLPCPLIRRVRVRRWGPSPPHPKAEVTAEGSSKRGKTWSI